MPSEIQDQEAYQWIVQPLLSWYSSVSRPLPWRLTKDPYKIWLSEIMLQQTRISAVLDYYARFTSTLPDISALAAVEEDALMKLWQGLGYYSRARNLQKAAKILVEKYNGCFPADYELIRSLPGIGDYTAGAIASIAFGIPVPAVDGNVLRVLTRLSADASDISLEKTKAAYRSIVSQIVPPDHPGEFNQALMELGELICLPNGTPLCRDCPLHDHCKAYQNGTQESYPVKKTPKPRRIEKRIVWIILHDGKVALRKRPEKGLLAGLWELPNQLSSEVPALSGWGIEPLHLPVPAVSGKHIFSHMEWHMETFALTSVSDTLPDGWVWATQEELDQVYALPNSFQAAFPYLKEALSAVRKAEPDAGTVSREGWPTDWKD